MDREEAIRLTEGLIWMPADLEGIPQSTLGEFPFENEVTCDIASAMEDLSVLQRKLQREYMLDDLDACTEIADRITAIKCDVHKLLIPDFDPQEDARIKLTPFENYDTTGRYDITKLHPRFLNSTMQNIALNIQYLAGWSSERDQYITRNDATLGEGERVAGLRQTQKVIASFRKTLAYLCGNAAIKRMLETEE